jgi:hypothetical protein
MRSPLPMTIIALVLLTASSVALSQPPPPKIDLPGKVAGEHRSYWLAPYVFVTEMHVGQSDTETVQWLGENGQVLREITQPQDFIEPGFVLERRPGGTTVHAVNGTWSIDLKEKPGPSGYITSTADSITFIDESHPKEHQIAADVYRDGKLLGTVGPYLDYLGRDVEVGTAGSLALLIWKDQKQSVPQVIGIGTDGREKFHPDCDGPVDSPDPNPDGTGVLVQYNGGTRGDVFAYYDKSGKVSQLDLGHDARLVEWVPGSEKALMETRGDGVLHLHLIDWRHGRQIWQAPDPNPARPEWEGHPIAIDEKYVLIGGLEYLRWENQAETIRRIDALDTKTGKTVATWHPVRATDPGRFLRLGQRLYLVTDLEFSQVDVDAIAAGSKGWEPAEQPHSK